MNVTTIFADAASVADGKLYVQGGGWHAVHSNQLPVVIPNLGIAVIIDGVAADFARGRQFALRLLDSEQLPARVSRSTPDGAAVDGHAEVSGELRVAEPSEGNGSMATILLAISFQNVWLASAEPYELEISIDGDVYVRSPLVARISHVDPVEATA
jgi:hypothetical protein